MTAKKYSEKLEETEKKINEYFKYCDSINAAAEESKKIPKPYTVSGMLYYIGITKKDYEKLLDKKKFAELFTRALQRIEVFLEENALAGNVSASVASGTLKNISERNGLYSDKGSNDAPGILKIVLDGELMKLAE